MIEKGWMVSVGCGGWIGSFHARRSLAVGRNTSQAMNPMGQGRRTRKRTTSRPDLPLFLASPKAQIMPTNHVTKYVAMKPHAIAPPINFSVSIF
jgi:hypothetical protein